MADLSEIRVLAPHVADLIAAGEVVERPASVVKELVENAIDAGATSVTIEIQRGGMSLIRVMDNGKGIPSDQCRTAFLRHATSKLREPEDLSAIGTLGFRGEALAAIAAVSRVELFTRTKEEPLGTALTLEGGTVLSQEEAGCPLGTTMVVRDLFFNTPARLKFMKKDAAEGAAVFALVQKLALSHPEVAMKFLRDGKQDLLTPGDGKLRSCLYGVLGRDMAAGYLPIQGESEGVTVTGFATLPACCRGSRSYQHFFVNGRQVKSKLLAAALERAYENQRMVGKFPGCVLQLQVKPSEVDVNVHPAKTEVKFLYERRVFDGVYYSLLSALTSQQQHPPMTFSQRSQEPEEPKRPPNPMAQVQPPTPSLVDRMRGMPDREIRSDLTLRDSGRSAAAALLRPEEKEISQPHLRVLPSFAQGKAEISPKYPEKSTLFSEAVDKSVENVEKPMEESSIPAQRPFFVPPPPPEATVPVPAPETEETPWHLVGEVLRTYVIVEQGEKIFLIDKHAAHERMQFDRMKAAGWEPMAQTLLSPLLITPEPQEGEILLENLPLLSRFGFSCEDFGGGTLAIRELPDDLDPGQAEETLCEIAQNLLNGDRADPTAARDAVLHTMACKAAVKGGQKNSREELMVVAKAVLSGKVKYCPHGRPVAITMTRNELEKQFKRV